MALTNLIAINRALAYLDEAGTPAAYPADVQTLIGDALKRFAVVVAASETDRQLLRKDYSITITSGVGSFAAAMATTEPPLIEAIPTAYLVITSGASPMQYLPDRAQLTLTRPLGFFIYWSYDEGNLRTRNTDGSLTSLSTTVTATMQYIPLISSVPSQLENRLIEILVEMLKTRGAMPPNQGDRPQ